jgi:valyl-tRNA synthetase
VPFRDIYITGLVRDKQGRKMSKSLGNGLDPLELIDEFGADALKFTIAFLCAQGQDVLFDRESVKLGSRFANKIWNASRYLLMNLEGRNLLAPGAAKLTDIDRWIRRRLSSAAAAARTALEGYRFNEAAQAVYEFIWSDFCDWYIEAAKLSLSGDGPEKDRIVTLLLGILEESLRLAHPFLPMITEEIYQTLPVHADSIMTQAYPAPDPGRADPAVEAKFASLQELVRAVRTIRAEFTIPPDRKIDVTVVPEAGAGTAENFEVHRALIMHLAGCAALSFEKVRPVAGDGEVGRAMASAQLREVSRKGGVGGRPTTGSGIIGAAGKGFEVFVLIKKAIDAPKEIARLMKDREKAESEVSRTQAKLANSSFVERAPKEVVDREKEKLEELARLIGKIDGYVRALEG